MPFLTRHFQLSFIAIVGGYLASTESGVMPGDAGEGCFILMTFT